MTARNIQARRATVDDLPVLRRLWSQAGLPFDQLERRLTEFQVAETPDGNMLGCLGLRVEGRHGVLHADCFADPESELESRHRLWQRVQTLARNHGLTRFWIQGGHPFWPSAGFVEPAEEDFKKAPASITADGSGWRHLVLREEADAAATVEREFQIFKLARQEEAAKSQRFAQGVKMLAWLVAIIVFLISAAFLVVFFKGYHLFKR